MAGEASWSASAPAPAGAGVLAEAIQIDGGVVALFLLVVVLLACAYLGYAVVGFRVGRRAAQPGAAAATRAAFAAFVVPDAVLVVWAVGVLVASPSNLAALILLVAPAAHGVGFLRGRGSATRVELD